MQMNISLRVQLTTFFPAPGGVVGLLGIFTPVAFPDALGAAIVSNKLVIA